MSPIARYAIAVVVVQAFAFKVLDPYYLQFMTTPRGINLSPVSFGFLVSLAAGVTFALDYLSGAFADKIGRRLSWAVSMFLYGAGMLWLSSVVSFGGAALTAILMGTSYAFASGAREAWLYDSVGEEGMRQAFGKIYLYSVPVTMLGGLTAFALGLFDKIRLPIFLTGIIVVANGVFILTFPENYGAAQRRSWSRIMKTGFQQFLQSRILWIVAAQSLFMTLPIWINTAWWVTYLSVDLGVGLSHTALAFGVTSVAAAIAGVYISGMKRTDYRTLIVYPTLVMAGAFLLMPFVRTPLIFVALTIASIAGAHFRGSGITLLENEQITEERATALSFLNTLRSSFWMLGPLAWGWVIQTFGLQATFGFAGLASLISLSFLALALRLRERQAP
jgi:MFS family permease